MADSKSDADWKKCHEGIVNNLMTERLKEAVRMRDRTMLERSIEDCTAYGVDKDHPQMKAARRTLRVMDIKDDLAKAVKEKDLDEIDRQVKKIIEGPYHKYLQLEVTEAQHMGELYEKHARLQNSILDMDRGAMFELRRYPNPPAGVIKVMQASLLLVGEDEATTEEWKRCSKFLNPDGRTGLNRRIMKLDADDVHPEIAARAQQILIQYELGQIRSVSAAAGTFYVWAMGVVDECLSKNTDTDQPVEPASIDRQREILARPPLTQEQPKDEKYDFRKRTWRPRQKGDPPPRRRTDGSKTNRANVEKPDWKT